MPRWVWVGLLLGTPLIGHAQRKPEPNAFLNKPAHSLHALVEQVRKDPKVRSRYARHFGMHPNEVVKYLKTLHLAVLEENVLMPVYNVAGDEVIRRRVFQLKKGAYVWVDPRGVPVLKKTCGNALLDRPARGQPVAARPSAMPKETLKLLEQEPSIGEPTFFMTMDEVLEPAFEPLKIDEPEPPQPPEPEPEDERPSVAWHGIEVLLPLMPPSRSYRPGDGNEIPGPQAALAFLLPSLARLRKRQSR